jgi:hypothetical protein
MNALVGYANHFDDLIGLVGHIISSTLSLIFLLCPRSRGEVHWRRATLPEDFSTGGCLATGVSARESSPIGRVEPATAVRRV